MLKNIGWNADGDFVNKLLKGLNASQTQTITEGDKILVKFITAVKDADTENGESIEEFQWQFGFEEYKATFSKIRESTACGPSGLHMTHQKLDLRGTVS